MLVLYPLIYSFIFPYHCHIVCHMIPLSLPYFPFMIPLYSLSIASGWWYTYPSEKYIRSSVGMMTFPTEWKVIKFHGSKPPISIVSLNMVYIYTPQNVSIPWKPGDDFPPFELPSSASPTAWRSRSSLRWSECLGSWWFLAKHEDNCHKIYKYIIDYNSTYNSIIIVRVIWWLYKGRYDYTGQYWMISA